MGFIARAQLASAVSNAGGLGIIETSSGLLSEVRDEIVKMRDLTDKPFGVNIAQLFVRDASIVDFVAENGVTFVTTSAGDPTKYTHALKEAGLTVFHVVPSLRGALKAVDAGVDGLVVEGNEGGGFKAPTGASTMVLLPLIASRVEVPVIAAGGICDGRSMAAALVLGAEGVQMGTRMVSAAESPVHENWKQLICTSSEGDTLLLNRHSPPAFRVLRTGFSESAEREDRAVIPKLESVHDLYFGGNLEASFAFSGQVAGRITEVLPVAQILRETIAECETALRETAARLRGLRREHALDALAGTPGRVGDRLRDRGRAVALLERREDVAVEAVVDDLHVGVEAVLVAHVVLHADAVELRLAREAALRGGQRVVGRRGALRLFPRGDRADVFLRDRRVEPGEEVLRPLHRVDPGPVGRARRGRDGRAPRLGLRQRGREVGGAGGDRRVAGRGGAARGARDRRGRAVEAREDVLDARVNTGDSVHQRCRSAERAAS